MKVRGRHRNFELDFRVSDLRLDLTLNLKTSDLGGGNLLSKLLEMCVELE